METHNDQEPSDNSESSQSYNDFGQQLNDVVDTLELTGQQLRGIAESMSSHKRQKVAHNVSNVDEVAKNNDAKNVTIVKVTCNGHPTIKFPLSLKSNVVELEENVRSRLKLKPGKLTLMYKDYDEDWIFISSDADLQYGLEKSTLRSWITFTIRCYDNENIVVTIICDGHPRVVFPLGLDSKVEELEENVRKRLKLEPGKLSMMYQDEDSKWVLIWDDRDLQYALETLTMKGRTIIRIQCQQEPMEQ